MSTTPADRRARDRGPPIGADTPPSIYRYIWKATQRSQIAVVALALLVVPLNIAPLELQKRIIDQGILASNLRLTLWLLAAYAGLAAAHAVLLYALNMQEGRIHEGIARRLRHQVLELIRKKRRVPETVARPGTVVTVYALEVDPVGEFAGQAISVPVVEGGIFLAVIGYMLFTEPILALVALAFFAPQAVLVPYLQEKINALTGTRIKLLRGASEEALGVLDGQPSAGLPQVISATRGVYGLRIKIYQLKYLMKYAVLFLIFAARIAVLGVGGYMVMQGETGIGVVVAFLTGLDRLTMRWNELVSFFRRMSDARLKFGLVADVLNRPR